ncbi:hypothetical protein Tco_1012276 [Tanacetum coccineum]
MGSFSPARWEGADSQTLESSKKEKGRKESKLIKISKKGRRGVTKRKKERKRPVVLQERKKVADHKKERKKARKKERSQRKERDPRPWSRDRERHQD